MNYRDGLEQLKHKSSKSEVSVLIGAGFSKNVYANYPSWDELLFDMVAHLYNPEIETGFNSAMHYNPMMKIDYREYCKNKVQEIIAREGYLDIVSKYINKKGYREAIETYIEERIPSIDESTFSLTFSNNSDKNQKILPLKINDFEAHVKLLEGPWENIYTTNYDGLLEFTAEKFHKKWNTIIEAQQLSFSKQAKSIIKLHGNLCLDNKDSFEFDGNHHHRYIISKEDYENYPFQHEAFTQLMRISLLQGTFCLIGFSGTDPNFIAWIKWVRDILVLNKRQEKRENYKIFLIDITDSKPTPDKQLFYNNHNIFHIPLLNDEIKEIIGAPNSKEPKQLIISFLSYLYDNTNMITQKYDFTPKLIYNGLWSRVCSYKVSGDIKHTQINVSIDDVILKQIREIKSSNRIVKYINYQDDILSRLDRNKQFSEQELQLLLLALQDTYYLPDCYPNLVATLDKRPLSKEQKMLMVRFKERSITLSSPNFISEARTEDCFVYEQVLRIAFRLDFTHLKQILTEWNPKDTYIPKKALFLSLFDDEKAKNILLNYIDTEFEVNERYFATQLLNLIDWHDPLKYSTAKYENQNIDGLYELKNKFIDKATKATNEKEDLKPYGYNGKTYQFGKSNTDYGNSLRVLQFLIEFPIFLKIKNYFEVINPKDWYKIFRQIFQEHPFPALFYSIQCTSEDVLKRIGQEYAYSDRLLKKEVPQILDCMLSALVDKDTPTFLESNLFELSKELFVSVKPSKWERSFLIIWENKVYPFYEKIESHFAIYKFVCTALQYVSSEDCITRILVDCLKMEKQNKNNTIAFLYYLKVPKKNVLSNISLQKEINRFVSNIDSDKEFAIADNLYPILSLRNINAVATKINKIIKGESVSEIAFGAATYFAKISKKNPQQVKQALISNKKLWGNGISGESASRTDFIRLSSLKKNIKWDKDELCIIYGKLKESFNQVINSHWYNDEKTMKFLPMKYDDLFDEMLRFITDYQKKLSAESDFSEIRTKLTTELEELRGYVNINEALISDDSDKIVHGLNQLYNNIITSKIQYHEASIDLLLDRILFKRKERLESCIDYIAYYLSRYYTKKNLSTAMIEKLQLILKIYTKETFQELDLEVPSNVKHLIQISDSLRKMGYGSEYIKYWLSIKKSKRFNNL
jgi:hypothetical protein